MGDRVGRLPEMGDIVGSRYEYGVEFGGRLESYVVITQLSANQPQRYKLLLIQLLNRPPVVILKIRNVHDLQLIHRTMSDKHIRIHTYIHIYMYIYIYVHIRAHITLLCLFIILLS